ncbi:type 1 glutamine amidotransferase [Desulfomonile tiedjei]|uniref:GMP synthase family protein n=1 Tax=Desulfomonile tiedjei (strain ATCC 49306 / DSM 6799 / DCB-1) TaxID=706587 RepID=I4C7I4_DESTA|nr:gamma-glutamyl-gamma-aminobutyrate hydrolase family protein [Desulfomonile tiedjei]AFM25525.1 GMP synthase family protein [Desulfomonile tiedjei DSM 6799]
MAGVSPKISLNRVLISVIVACILIVSLMWYLTPSEHILRGLLIDLELSGPEQDRYRELVHVLTHGVSQSVPAARNLKADLSYLHYSEFSSSALDRIRPDFLVLSPQSTPWHMYRGRAGEQLEYAKQVLKSLVADRGMPILGICGGHQFLALTFGAKVDFIDTRFSVLFPERYPKEAVSEKGIAQLEMLRPDPIFSGLAIPGSFQVMESHYEEVKSIPEPFVNLARSNLSEVQLIRIPGKLVYGMAFHPERTGNLPQNTCTDGKILLANFLKMVALNNTR